MFIKKLAFFVCKRYPKRAFFAKIGTKMDLKQSISG